MVPTVGTMMSGAMWYGWRACPVSWKTLIALPVDDTPTACTSSLLSGRLESFLEAWDLDLVGMQYRTGPSKIVCNVVMENSTECQPQP